jgi:hypothetical protein
MTVRRASLGPSRNTNAPPCGNRAARSR